MLPHTPDLIHRLRLGGDDAHEGVRQHVINTIDRLPAGFREWAISEAGRRVEGDTYGWRGGAASAFICNLNREIDLSPTMGLSDAHICANAERLAEMDLMEGKVEVEDYAKTLKTHRKNLRREAWRGAEMFALRHKLVGRGGSKYVSSQGRRTRRQQRRRWDKFSDNIQFKNKADGNQISLTNIRRGAARGRFAELYTFCKGLELTAKANGFGWMAVTLTTPGRFHPNPAGAAGKWDGSSPLESHRFIHRGWRRVRDVLRKNEIDTAGFRVTEPHRDGCAHWHAMVMFHKNDQAEVERAIRGQFRGERAAHIEIGDDHKGSFSNYCFKYLQKTLTDSDSDSGEDKYAEQADAWRGIWGVRAFQFWGMPSFGAWRTLRRIGEPPSDKRLAMAWRAARGGDIQKFVALAGGVCVRVRDRPIRTCTIEDTGECGEVIRRKAVKNMNTLAIEIAPASQWTRAISTVIGNGPRRATPNSTPNPNPSQEGVWRPPKPRGATD